METAKITSKGQMTIPRNIREQAHLKQGDVLVLDVQGGEIVMHKLVMPTSHTDDDYLSAVQTTLSEWSSPEDEDAFNDL